MALKSGDKVDIHVRCRCCFVENSSRDLWAEYICDGKIEVYGEMLVECFGLPLVEPLEYREQICESCVARLRDAVNFRQDVVATSQLIIERTVDEQKSPENDSKFKYNVHVKHLKETQTDEENLEDIKAEFEHQLDGEQNEEEFFLIQADDDDEEFKVEYAEDDDDDDDYVPEDSISSQDEEYFEIEFLEDDEDAVKAQTVQPQSSKRKRKSTGRPYKQYSEAQLREAVDAVRSGRMTRTQASVHYSVPSKTLSARIRRIMETGKPMREIAEMTKHYENLRVILENTNATPIRGHWGQGYACCFCAEQYGDPNNLKIHTLKQHDKNTRTKYQKGKCAYEFSVKLDITNLECHLCSLEINGYSLEDLFEHLTEHNVMIHKDINNQIVPFRFDGEILKCTKCSAEFNYFKLLNEHMSEHYGRYKCTLCNRTFLNKSNLRVHRYRHVKGDFQCRHCQKKFTTKVRTQQHERVVHQLNGKAHRCGYCKERFMDAVAKYKHESQTHGAMPKKFQCQACASTFTRQRSLTEHIQLYHLLLKPYKCHICDKGFIKARDVARHTVTHTGLKEFQCEQCAKCFSRENSLKEHLKMHSRKEDKTHRTQKQ